MKITRIIVNVSAIGAACLFVAGGVQASPPATSTKSATGLGFWIAPAAPAPTIAGALAPSLAGRVEALGAANRGNIKSAAAIDGSVGSPAKMVPGVVQAPPVTPEPAPALTVLLGLLPLAGLATFARRRAAGYSRE